MFLDHGLDIGRDHGIDQPQGLVLGVARQWSVHTDFTGGLTQWLEALLHGSQFGFRWINHASSRRQSALALELPHTSRVQPVDYAEIIATVASKSIGPGTRKNIDEFTRTTSNAVAKVGGAKVGKAIVVVNPAEPPLMMRDTVYCETADEPDQEAITKSVHEMVAEVQKYVPGYRLNNGPTFEGRKVSIFLEVEGLGDYLPKYAGNLDIMTAAGARTAEMFAREIIDGKIELKPTEAEAA